MTDVFISYAHEDQDFVRRMVAPLEAEGFSVWWDHTIPPGQSWDEVITRGIEGARCCIVLWSTHSVNSDWVKEEATIAKDKRKLLPATIDGCEPPVGFRRIQAAHLQNWNGSSTDPQWAMLVKEVRAVVSGERREGAAAAPRPTPHQAPARVEAPAPKRAPMALIAGLGVLALGGAAAFFVMQPGQTQPAAQDSAAPALDPAAAEVERLNQERAQDQERHQAEMDLLRRQNEANSNRTKGAEPAPAAQAPQAITEAWLLGAWRFNWQARSGAVTGTINVSHNSAGALVALIELTRTADSVHVRQRAFVNITGAAVVFDGYEVLSADVENWNPDNFYVERSGERLNGYSQDDAGTRGSAVTIYR